MISRAGRRLFILYTLRKFGAPVEDMLAVFQTYIRPILEYACAVWHPALTKQQSHQLERIQKRSCKIILGNNYQDYQSALQDLKGTNGRQKTYEIFHVYCIFYSGFMCQTTVIFGITKDGSLVLSTLASWNCFTCRNLFQNGANDMSECLTFETAFCKKAQNFV